jgi:hypothetical protein
MRMRSLWMGLGWMSVGLMGMGGVAWGQVKVTGGFMQPTAEELSMTSLPGYPGVSAVVLFREEVTNDNMHYEQHYDRIKVLTKDGEKYANVELPFVSMTGLNSDNFSDEKSLGDIQGRTIHADGKIIPFTGKPYLKVMEKTAGAKVQEKVFTLPDVEVGSIIEYRYATRIADNIFESPDWYIQGELYLKAAHYVWYPTERQMTNSREQIMRTITWYPILPEGAKVERHDIPKSSNMATGSTQYFDLQVKEIPPQVKERYMPPMASYSYRVLFNFTAETSAADWWKAEGKEWSKQMDAFANPNSDLKSATQKIVAGATTPDEKLKKIYAAVMGLDNTRYTRQHEEREDKAEGEGKVKTAADVLGHGRGTASQIALVFVGMARAAGMQAYVMDVPDRSEEFFTPNWLSFQQFDDLIAIVNVDGKEVFFDPGCRYCAYGHLAWEHTFVQGLRQVERGTDFAKTQGDDYKVNVTNRVANLNVDEKGEITGTINLSFTGSAAVRWRHTALTGDDESLKHALRTHLESMVPKSLEVKVESIENLKDYEDPLTVNYTVQGRLGTPTGKRLILPSDLFEAGSSAIFSDEKREQLVYFHYPQTTRDTLRINVPSGFDVEAVPTEARLGLPNREIYNFTVTADAKGFTSKRFHAQNEIFIQQKDYEGLRKYYSEFQSKDQESVVLKVAPATSATDGAPGAN